MIYTKDIRNPKIIKILIIATIILVFSILISKSYNVYQVNKMNKLTQDIYNHPLKVSNHALYVKTNLYKIHRDMKDIVLYPNENDLKRLIKQVKNRELDVYRSLDIIKKHILGDEGRKLEHYTRTMFQKWSPIREKVIELSKNNNYEEAIGITKGVGADHVILLEESAKNLYLYAQEKATHFKNESMIIFDEFEKFNLIITLVFLGIFLFMSYYIIKKLSKDIEMLEANRILLETIINESPNPIMLHNEKGKVLMVNKVLEELCEYTYEEINTIEKWRKHIYGKEASPIEEYIENLYKSDHRVEEGEVTIKTKSGKKLIWNFSSTPIGKIDNVRAVISSAMDITKLKDKDNLLYIQSRHAAMGEMLSNISHQWRQPLSLISTISTGSELTYTNKNFDEQAFRKSMQQINNTVQYLSKTIDDFRNFFNPNKEKNTFSIKTIFEKTFSLISTQFSHRNINIIKEIRDVEIMGFENELLQVIINILNNSRDALELKKIKEKNIFINVHTKDEKVLINIKDNAGGINEEIIEKVFDPYFTTKHQTQGTGIGLYMSEEIIEKHMNGEIKVKNETYKHKDIEYIGASFTITLPLD